MNVKKGRRVSPQTEFKKGNIPWNKGRPHSPETIKRLKGKHLSPKTEYKKGHRPSEETRIRQSKSARKRFEDPHEREKARIRNLGRKNPGQAAKMKKLWEDLEYKERQFKAHYRGGPKVVPKKYTTKKEQLAAQSKRMKELWGTEEFRKKMIRTEEWKEKISKANKGRKRAPYSKELIRKMLRRNIPTSLEVAFLNIVKKHNLPYKYVGDGSVIIGRKNPDFININGKKTAVEVYARYYKNRDKRFKDIDEWKEKRREIFSEYGWNLIFFDETQVKEDIVLKSLGGD